ncbi:MAG: hypothetical protein ACE5D4_04155 [Thermodesulfobacteriota bacterium]
MILIIDIERDNVRAGIFTAKTMAPDGFFTQPIVVPDKADGVAKKEALHGAISALLVEMEERGFTRFQRVIAGIPSGDLTLRVLPIPFEERAKIIEVLPFEVAPLLPIEADEMIIEGVPIGKGGEGKVVAVAVEKRLVGEYLDILNNCGLDPCWLGSSLCSLDTLVVEVAAETAKDGNDAANDATVALIREDSMVVVSAGKPFFFKHLSGSGGIGDIKLSALYLESEGIKVERCYVTGWSTEEVASLFPSSTVESLSLPFDYPTEGAGVLSMALHHKRSMTGGVNFRRGEFAYTKEKDAARRGLTYTAILAAIVCSLLAGNLSFRYLNLAKEGAATRESLQAAYRTIFHKQGKVVDELYQLESQMKVVDNKLAVVGSGLNILEIMTRVAEGGKVIGDGKLTLHELSVGEGRLTAKGETGSFEEATKLRDTLRDDPIFRDVTLTNVTAGGDGKTHFSLSMKIGGEGS